MNAKTRKQIYGKYDGLCAYCGCELNGKFHVDHLIAKERFKSQIINNYQIPVYLSHLTQHDVNHIDNLMPACCSCNNYKNTFTLDDFRKQIGLLVERLNTRFTQYKIAKRYGLVLEDVKPVIFYFETIKDSYWLK